MTGKLDLLFHSRRIVCPVYSLSTGQDAVLADVESRNVLWEDSRRMPLYQISLLTLHQAYRLD